MFKIQSGISPAGYPSKPEAAPVGESLAPASPTPSPQPKEQEIAAVEQPISDQRDQPQALTQQLQQVSASLDQVSSEQIQHLAQKASEAGFGVPTPPPLPELAPEPAPLSNVSGFNDKLQEIQKLAESSSFRDREIALNRLETLLNTGTSNAQKVKAYDLMLHILDKVQPPTESLKQQLLQAELGKIAYSGQASDSEGPLLADQAKQLTAFQEKHKKSLTAMVVNTHMKVQALQIKASGLEKKLKDLVAIQDLQTLEHSLTEKQLKLAALLSSNPGPETRIQLENLLLSIRTEKNLLQEQVEALIQTPHLPDELKPTLREYMGLRHERIELTQQKNLLDLLANLKIAEHQIPFLTGPDFAFLEPGLAQRTQLGKAQNQIWQDFGKDQILTKLVTEPNAPVSEPGLVDLSVAFSALLAPITSTDEAQQKIKTLLTAAGRGSDLYWSVNILTAKKLKELLAETLPPALKTNPQAAVNALYQGVQEAFPDTFDGKVLTFNGITYPSVNEFGEQSANGIIFLCKTEDQSQAVILKFAKPTSSLDEEIQLHRQAMSRSLPGTVVPLEGIIRGGENAVGMVLDYADRGTLTNVVKTLPQFKFHDEKGKEAQLPDKIGGLIRKHLALQVIQRVDTMQNSGNITHLDLKGDNLLVNSKGEIMVADFGTSELGHESKPGSMTGTSHYMAPEVVSKEMKYNHKADNWSTGIVLQEILGIFARPYEYEKKENYSSAFIKTARWAQNKENRVMPNPSPKPVKPGETPQKTYGEEMAETKLFNQLLHPDPAQRPTLKAIQEMAYFKEARQQALQLQELFTLMQNKPKQTPANPEQTHGVSDYQKWSQRVRELCAELG